MVDLCSHCLEVITELSTKNPSRIQFLETIINFISKYHQCFDDIIDRTRVLSKDRL